MVGRNRNQWDGPRQSSSLGATPRNERRRRGLIGWLALGLGALALLVLLVRGGEEADERGAADLSAAGAATGDRVSDAGDPMVAASSYGISDLDRYLAGTEPVGRAFALNRVTFASGSEIARSSCG